MNAASHPRRGRPRLKTVLKEAAAAAILDAAEEVLLKEGMLAPMEAIAARAGVAVGTLYNHFSDRQQLVEALLNRHRAAIGAAVSEAREANAGLPMPEQLRAMLKAMFGQWTEMMLVVRQQDRVPDAKKRAQMRTRLLELFGPVLARGRAEGVLADEPEDLQILALIGLLQNYFILAVDEPKRLSGERAVDLACDFFLKGAAP